YVGMMGRHKYGGYPLAFLAQLEIEYADGTRDLVVTDGSWSGSAGPLVGADLLMGEVYDARLEMPGWDVPASEAAARVAAEATSPGGVAVSPAGAAVSAVSTWRPVEVLRPEVGSLVAQVGPPIRATLELDPVGISRPEPGVYIFDLGQNM